jgi:putative DNA primase/helicase
MILDDLADDAIWVAWRNERRGNKTTKVPISPNGDNAKTDDPDTWGDLRRAKAAANEMLNGQGGGIGVMLGVEIGNSTALGGVDLDTCIADREIGEWALDVIDRFASYTEISPSGQGVKVFFLYRLRDLHRLRILMGTEHGRMFKRRGGTADHPPAIELHVSNRYFTVTGEVIDQELTELRVASLEDLEWLIREAGPAFVGQGIGKDRDRVPRDNSRSGAAFRLGLSVRRAGGSFDAFRDAVRNDPDTTEWYTEKGAANDQRELHRIWEKCSGPPWQINPAAPYDTARLLLQVGFSRDDWPLLHRHRGGFYLWDGKAYPEFAEAEIRARIYAFLDECVVPVKNDQGQREQAPARPNTRKVNEVADALRAVALLPDTVRAPAWLVVDPADPNAANLLACTNGLLDLSTGKLLPHTPSYFTHTALDYDYDPNASKPKLWLRFLDELWGDDAESIDTLQELFGYCLAPDTSQQKMFMVVGPKRSGKGTIARVLRRLVGVDNAVAPTLASLGANFGLAPLIGKQVAIISDARLGGRADQAAIAERLLSITGEDALTIDRKYREAWTGRLGVRFLVLTNELPRFSDTSGALASRFIVLALIESFYGREDPALTDNLIPELPGILNWAIAGWRRFRRRGYFVQPASANELIDDLEALASPVGAFVREMCIVGPGEREDVDEMFKIWCAWCSNEGRSKPGTKQTFGRDLRAAVPAMKVRQNRREGFRFYDGIGVRRSAAD